MFTSDPIVQVRNACIFQGINTVLQDVSFSIEKYEFVFLIGRTGSGKSSLLKTLYADLKLQMGEAEVAGYTIHNIKNKDIPYLRRKIGIVFQDFQLFTDRTVADNLIFVMKATGWKDRAKMKTRLAEVLMRVGLGSAATKMPHQLSGGEQQRVVIARALLNDPSILLADEPTGNLDPEVADGIFQLFQDINKQGTAILMATHNHELLKKHPYRVLKCEKGKLLDSKTSDFTLSTSL
jgi:cell division transport system ATP-binding protein